MHLIPFFLLLNIFQLNGTPGETEKPEAGVNGNSAFKAGTRLEISWKGQWYKGTIPERGV